MVKSNIYKPSLNQSILYVSSCYASPHFFLDTIFMGKQNHEESEGFTQNYVTIKQAALNRRLSVFHSLGLLIMNKDTVVTNGIQTRQCEIHDNQLLHFQKFHHFTNLSIVSFSFLLISLNLLNIFSIYEILYRGSFDKQIGLYYRLFVCVCFG